MSMIKIGAGKASQAVFRVMQRKVTDGEIEDVKSILPVEFRNLWPHQTGG